MNRIIQEDCSRISKVDFIDWSAFKNRTFLITGSTGLIGQNLVYALASINEMKNVGMRIILPVRNTEVAHRLFGKNSETISIINYSLGDHISINEEVDYIIHLASPTNSKYFSDNPVDTIESNFDGIRALLDYSINKRVSKIVYLSTMEVYGNHTKGTLVNERNLGSFETMKPRNSYPIAKLACEALCNAYYSQYGVPVLVLRATQTFGPGVKYDDGRVFAQFMRCVIENEDIVLRSAGLTERSYLYTADAVTAILVALQKGKSGDAYTVANPDTYCSIKDMAMLVADRISGGRIKVIFDIVDDICSLGYSDTLYMNLDVSKISGLGWYPLVGLYEMYERMISYTNEMTERIS